MNDEEWDEECRKNGWYTDKELQEGRAELDRMEHDGIADTQKYFDRIHDKLFDLNNILIAAYFALIAIKNDVPSWVFLIPIANSLLLLNIDYRMMIRARIQSKITEVQKTERDRYGSIQKFTNLYSLVSIYSTISVLLIFGYFLFF